MVVLCCLVFGFGLVLVLVVVGVGDVRQVQDGQTAPPEDTEKI